MKTEIEICCGRGKCPRAKYDTDTEMWYISDDFGGKISLTAEEIKEMSRKFLASGI